jgi:glucosamine-6-phosphate deaminase
MNLVVVEDYDTLSRVAADIVCYTIRANPHARIVVPTGNTPVGMYEELALRAGRGQIDASNVTVIQLDDYLGIADDDPRSLFGWMNRAFIQPLGIRKVVRLNQPGLPDGWEARHRCLKFEEEVTAGGGIDLAVLGIGPNGHVGFNEPPVPADAATRVVTLTDESIRSNAAYWGGEHRVPRRAITAGTQLLLQARHTLLLVSGEKKRDILRRLRSGTISNDVPASHLHHLRSCTVLADAAAVGNDC